MAKLFVVIKTNSEVYYWWEYHGVKEQPLLTDDDLTMFPDSVTSPEVTSESTPIITERWYPSQPRRPHAQYWEQTTQGGRGVVTWLFIGYDVITHARDIL